MDLKAFIALVIAILAGYWLPFIAGSAGFILLGIGISPIFFPKMGSFLENKGWSGISITIIGLAALITIRIVHGP